LLADNNNQGGAWGALPNQIIASYGATVYFTAGELMMPAIATGAAFYMEPIASTLGNLYGDVTISNSALETPSSYTIIRNTGSLSPITNIDANFTITGCSGYHSQNNAPMIQVAADYSGKIVVQNNNFYAGTPRSYANIGASGNLVNIYCDSQSFGQNFVQGLQAISGGIVHFDYRVILQASNCNSQALSSNVDTVLNWQSLTTTQDTVRFNNNYSSSTGLFTVPPGGLKSVTVDAVVRTSQPTNILEMSVYLNGSLYSAANTMMGGAGNSGWQRASVIIGDVTAGTTIAIYVVQVGVSSTTNGGAYENMTIMARN